MKRNSYKKWLVFSNVAFLVSLGFSLHYDLHIHAALILAVTLVSFIYHLAANKILGVLDVVLAYSLIGSNIVLVFLGKFTAPYFPLVVFFVMIAIYLFYHKKRETYAAYHIGWHASSAAITILSAATYLYR